ncbi:MAG TPA: Holliday junction resolvase RuvX [Firmicutes bacterium]|jgi:putative Holliday junction resolvase|nr:Holliday junction resolvase RuvX [Bacillota bacterium]
MQRILGLDVGNKTIGVAASDPLGLTAQGVTVLRRSSLAADLEALQELLDRYQASEVAVGLPLNMNGSKGPQAEVAEAFGNALAAKGVTVNYVDERLSTVAAERALLAGDVRRSKRKNVIDMIAAQLILEVYLGRRQAGK